MCVHVGPWVLGLAVLGKDPRGDLKQVADEAEHGVVGQVLLGEPALADVAGVCLPQHGMAIAWDNLQQRVHFYYYGVLLLETYTMEPLYKGQVRDGSLVPYLATLEGIPEELCELFFSGIRSYLLNDVGQPHQDLLVSQSMQGACVCVCLCVYECVCVHECVGR